MPEHSPSPTPERAIYGFILYLFAWVFLVLYLVWAYIPDAYLHAAGLTYWPQKYWALAAPCYAVWAIVFLIVIYVAINFTSTPKLDSVNTITDQHSKPAPKHKSTAEAIPKLGDIPISEVNRTLYLQS